MGTKRKFLFYYLNTGAGHISAAKVLSRAMKQEDDSVQIKMLNGFHPHKLGHMIFERGYNFSLNFFHGLFPLIYDLGQFRFTQTLFLRVLEHEAVNYLKKQIYAERPTDIVSFHFALTPYIRKVIKTLPWKVNFTCIVTDPFTAPHCWFYDRFANYMVYSEEAKKIAVQDCGVPEKNVTVVPFIMNEKFRSEISPEEIKNLKIKHGFNPNKKIVLLVGGGEGLPGATEILNECILKRNNFSIAIICGRDITKYHAFSILSKTYPRLDFHVYGFVDFLDELVKISDCAVIKAGPATMLEVLSSKKPVRICRDIHHQELGNLRFAVSHKVGWYIRKPKLIYKKINELLNDTQFDLKMKKNFENIRIDTDASKIVKILLQK